MQELKFRDRSQDKISPAARCCTEPPKDVPQWITGRIMTLVGPVDQVSTELSGIDRWEHIKCRTTAYRNDYRISPGLYAAGNPDRNSDVFASANYKYSFDMLRNALRGINAWILVLDTQGINVWCAAGKGTFGTGELVKRISEIHLDKVVDHKRIIVPQLGGPGISAFKVTQSTGFRVLYGPVYAKDIAAYVKAGHKATEDMRRVHFSFSDRLVLTPMEINPAMKKYPLYALAVLIVFGLTPSGVLFRESYFGGLPFLLLGIISIFSGAFLTPLFLPYIPFRSFAVKGWLTGLISVFLSSRFIPMLAPGNKLLHIITYLFFPIASSYIALQFTGSTTFTGMSGVKKELKIAMPAYLVVCAISVVLLLTYKVEGWRLI